MNDQPYVVLKYEHIKVGRGSASVKLKIRNIITGQVVDKGCVSTEKFEDADVYRKMPNIYTKRTVMFLWTLIPMNSLLFPKI